MAAKGYLEPTIYFPVGAGLRSRPRRTSVHHCHREVLRRVTQHRGDLSVQI